MCVCACLRERERDQCVVCFPVTEPDPCRQSGWLTGLMPRRWPSYLQWTHTHTHIQQRLFLSRLSFSSFVVLLFLFVCMCVCYCTSTFVESKSATYLLLQSQTRVVMSWGFLVFRGRTLLLIWFVLVFLSEFYLWVCRVWFTASAAFHFQRSLEKQLLLLYYTHI